MTLSYPEDVNSGTDGAHETEFWRPVRQAPRGLSFEVDDGIPTYRWNGTAWFPRIPYANAQLWVSCGCKLFEQYVKEYGMPDILHAHSLLYGGILAREISLKFGIPFVVTEHNSAFGRELLKRWQLDLARKAADEASLRLAVSEAFCNHLSKVLKGKASRWQYLPNIVSADFEKAGFEEKKRSDSFIFCNVSFLNKNKGLDILLRAFALAFKKQPDVSLTLGGKGPEELYLKQLAEDLDIKNRVHFPGMLSRKQVIDVMKNSHSYVLSSHFETFGVVLVEALALGRPVIATKCGGPESIVTPQDGYLVPPNEVKLLAEAMRRMYEEYGFFDQKGIRERCLDRFGEQVITEKLNEIYHCCPK